MAMELNRAWVPSDYRALAKRISYAAGGLSGAAKSGSLSANELSECEKVAQACAMFLKVYEAIKPNSK